MNVHKTFRRRPRRLLNVLCTFSLPPVSMGFANIKWILPRPNMKSQDLKQTWRHTIFNYKNVVCDHGVHDVTLFYHYQCYRIYKGYYVYADFNIRVSSGYKIRWCTVYLQARNELLLIFQEQENSSRYNSEVILIRDLVTNEIVRSSRSQTLFKIGILKTFANFTVKHLCPSHF